MIYSLLVLIAFSCFSSTHISFAMEKEKSIISQEITDSQQIWAIQDPQFARYITNNLVVIGGKGCALFDLTTNESTKMSTHYCSWLDVHPDKKKIGFSHDNTIEIYDLEADKQQYKNTEKHFIDSFAFNPLADNLVLSLTKDTRLKDLIITKRNYAQDVLDDKNFIENGCYSTSAFSAKQQLVCIAESGGDILLYPLANLTEKPKKITLFHDISDCTAGCNDFVAAIDSEGRVISLIKLKDNYGTVYWDLKAKKNQTFIRAFFYPIGDVLVTTSMITNVQSSQENSNHLDDFWSGFTQENAQNTFTYTYSMDYWDINTQEIIHTMQLEEMDNDFSFGDDGKNMIVAFKNMCQIFPVPFLEIIYKDEIEKRFPLLLLLLEEQINKCEQAFPQEISLLLKYTLFKTFKR